MLAWQSAQTRSPTKVAPSMAGGAMTVPLKVEQELSRKIGEATPMANASPANARIRACFKNPRVPVLVPSPAWRGATSEHTHQRSVSEEQRSQTGLGDETPWAAVLLAGDGVDSFLTARCGDARDSPPCPRPKSLAAGTLVFLKQALN